MLTVISALLHRVVFPGADATKEEMKKGGHFLRRIVVKDTAISQATGGPRGADGRVLDMHGKSLVVRNTSTEHTGVHGE